MPDSSEPPTDIDELREQLASAEAEQQRRLEHAFWLRSEELRAAAEERARLERELREARAATDRTSREREERLERRLMERANELERATREYLRLGAELKHIRRDLAHVVRSLEAVKRSRSWRWGNRLARLLRRLTFRPPVGGGALDEALDALWQRDGAIAGALSAGAPRRALVAPHAELERRARERFAHELEELGPAARAPEEIPADSRAILLPSGHTGEGAEAPSVDVVVCVHDALADLKRCLSALVTRTERPFHLILVNDGSGPATSDYLRRFRDGHPTTELIENSRPPHGYTYAANRGLRASRADYVVLLNSDTVPTRGWLGGIVAAGESGDAIGVVGPLSNAATHQSVPKVTDESGWAVNSLPQWLGEEGLALLVAAASKRQRPRVPFLNGFCYAIKRQAIDRVGDFDEELFGEGYSEENDFSLRAGEAGLSLVVADDAYVYHAKSRSYGAGGREALAKRSYQRLLDKHGEAEVSALVTSLKENSVLGELRGELAAALESEDALRRRFRELIPDPLRICFVLPGIAEGGGGGAHSIYQEVSGMRDLGIEAVVALPSAHLDRAREVYGEPAGTFLDFEHADELVQRAGEFDVVVATHHASVPLTGALVEANPEALPAYYIQDYEALFADEDTAAATPAIGSYEEVADQVLFAKTDWLCQIVSRAHGLNVHKIEPSLDTGLFNREERSAADNRVRIAAMVRPRTPRRQALFTLRVLERLAEEEGIEIRTFGCKQEELNLLAGPDRGFEHRGLLGRAAVAELLKDSDVFLDASVYQAFGRTGLEAMACGCVPVLPVHGGVHEYASDGESALLVDTTNPLEPLQALRRLSADSQLLERLREGGAVVAGRYSQTRAALSEYALFQHEWQQRAARARGHGAPPPAESTEGSATEESAAGNSHYRPYSFAGGQIYLDVSESPMMRARARGTFEPEKVRYIQRHAKAGMTFVDVGANKGDFALIAAKAVGPSGRVVVFEPEPENCGWIRKSVALNGYPNIELIQVALSDQAGTAQLHLGKKSGWHSLVPSDSHGTGEMIEVATTTLDAALRSVGCRRVDMIKIDTEGAELLILRGAEEMLGASERLSLLLDLHPQRGIDPREVCSFLGEHGFSLRRMADPDRELQELPKTLTEVLAVR